MLAPRSVGVVFISLLLCLFVAACGGSAVLTPTPLVPTPTPLPTPRPTPTLDPGIVAPTDGGETTALPAVAARMAAVAAALEQPIPILLLDADGSLSDEQVQAQELALQDPRFASAALDQQSGAALRSEIFGIYPIRESDITDASESCRTASCYRVEMYNYALNATVVAIVDVTNRQVVAVNYYSQTQPDLPPLLTEMAIEIAINAPSVEEALGFKPVAGAAVMPNIKTALNRTLCERSRHLCVAPTFLFNDRALWAVVDLTEGRLVGLRWTDLGEIQSPPVTEKTIQNESIYANFCDKTTNLARDGWQLDYILTSSDGLRISDVTFQDQLVLDSAKLVDYHVGYSETEGFGYSDAVGCPIFSQAAVLALEPPQVEDILEDGTLVGFALTQDFRSELWPLPCNYRYTQRYEFYLDGRFHAYGSNYGRGCGNDGTYRLVMRLAPAGINAFAQWDGSEWVTWAQEQWVLQTKDAPATAEGYMYRVQQPTGSGYYIAPYWDDPDRAQDAYMYVTRRIPGKDEGDADLITIGSCCNTDYQQGPEQFLEPQPDSLVDAEIALWYVPALENDDTPGSEYCWADYVLEDGVFVPQVWPCTAGLQFTPFAAVTP